MPASAAARTGSCIHHPIARVEGSYVGLAAPGGTSIDSPTSTTPTTSTVPTVGLLQVDAGLPPSRVVPHVDGDGTARADSVDVLDQRSDRLLLDGLTLLQKDLLAGLADPGTHGGATGWLVNGHHIVDYGYSNRSGSTYWRFDLDARCGK